jgi:hypothetical protein
MGDSALDVHNSRTAHILPCPSAYFSKEGCLWHTVTTVTPYLARRVCQVNVVLLP